MTLPDINFRNIRKHRNSQNDGFEELTRQLVLAEPPKGHTYIENRGPGADGGVEILVRFPNDRVWGWQSKYFPDSFGASEVGQLKESFTRAMTTYSNLDRYFVAVPRNFSGSAGGSNKSQTQRWTEFKAWCENEAAKVGRKIPIELWDETYFVSKLQRSEAIYSGMRLYWFNDKAFDTGWFAAKLTSSLAYIGKRYRPQDHVDVLMSKTVCLLRRKQGWEKRLQHVRDCVAAALSSLHALDKQGQESPQFFCLNVIDALQEFIANFADCDSGTLYAHPLSEFMNRISNLYHNSCITSLNDAAWQRLESSDSIGRNDNYIYSDSVRKRIDLITSKLQEAGSEFSPTEIALMQQPFLIVKGDAGVGKSHLLAHDVEDHIQNGSPALFIPARVIDHCDKPEQELLKFLDIADVRFETFLAALQSAALTSGAPAFIVIDGLNETLFPRGWESGLPSLISQIKKFDRIALCVSIRSAYRRLCIREDLGVAEVVHHGFSGHLGQAAKEYLDRHGIERPSAPIFGLNEILHNPLFLSTAVDFMTAKGLTSFPRGLDSLAVLIGFWLEAVELNLITKKFERISVSDGKIQRIMERLASRMAAAGSEFVEADIAHKICEEVVDLAPPSKESERLLPRLIDEGLLLDFPSTDSDTGKRVSFAFQKFSDYFIADALIRDCSTAVVLAKELKPSGKYEFLFAKDRYNEFSGPRVALLALVPARLGQELPLIEDNFFEHVCISVDEFVSSLSWRQGKHISNDTVRMLVD